MSPSRIPYVTLTDDTGAETTIALDASTISVLASLATESGGNLDAIRTALQILTQLQTGAGKADGNTLRTVTAADDPSTQGIGTINDSLLALLGAVNALGLKVVPNVATDISGLAVEDGGNLERVALALTILTQLQTGQGKADGNTLRAVLADDDPAVQALLALVPLLSMPMPTLPVGVASPSDRLADFSTDSMDVTGSVVGVYGTVETVSRSANGASVPRAFIVSTTAVRLAGVNVGRDSMLITNNGSGSLFVGTTKDVASSGPMMGLLLAASGGELDDSGDGLWPGEWWGIYSAVATVENVAILETY